MDKTALTGLQGACPVSPHLYSPALRHMGLAGAVQIVVATFLATERLEVVPPIRSKERSFNLGPLPASLGMLASAAAAVLTVARVSLEQRAQLVWLL